MIPQSHISKISNRLLKEQGGRRIPEHVVERDYCIAWFLVGLSRSTLRNKLVFKGGTALRRCHYSDYRFSEDLDFTLLQPLSFEELKQELEPIYEEVKHASNITFRFSRPDPITHQNSYTFYLMYEGPLPVTSTPKEIKVDVTIKEKVYYAPEELAVIKSYHEFTDLPEGEKILTYSLCEIAAEKTVALLDRARTEPRDLYDLWYLTEKSGLVELSNCLEAINEKLAYRGKKLDEISEEFHKKEARLKKTWVTRLAAQMASLSEFDSIYRAIKRIFRQAKITDGNKNKSSGFTLLEILIALFIFAILALLLSNALHNVIGVQSRTEQNAERLHDTQIALVMMLRDISQAVNRPVMTAGGKDEVAFVGRPDGFTFTHMGITNADGKFLRSDMQRARYFVDGKTLWRYTWPVLDQAPNTIPAKRILLNDLEEASFEYLDSKHVFHSEWPLQEVREILPRAVKVTLTIAKWGKLTQLYLIPAEPVAAATNQQPAKTDGKSNDKTSDKSNEKTPPNKP